MKRRLWLLTVLTMLALAPATRVAAAPEGTLTVAVATFGNERWLPHLYVGAEDVVLKPMFENLLKVSDFTVANAVALAGQMTYANKDKLLLIAVDRVTDLTPSGALALSKAGYGQQQQILEKALKKLEGKS